MKFKKGDRVKLSAAGISQLDDRKRYNDKTRGIVVGKSIVDDNCWRILRDGIKYPESYHEKFWELSHE